MRVCLLLYGTRVVECASVPHECACPPPLPCLCVPLRSRLHAGFDCRIPVTQDLAAFRAMLDAWTAEDGVSYEFALGERAA